MKKAIDYKAAETSQLETWLKHPRSAEDAHKIREELKTRTAGRPDTGTMSLFNQEPRGAAAYEYPP